MKNLRRLDNIRCTVSERSVYGANGGAAQGMFTVRRNEVVLTVIASTGGGWDHVSVSTAGRAPTWDEMEYVKRLFFKDNETAMQLHVRPSDHIKLHPHCLHLWRPQDERVPLPPKAFV